MTTYTENLTQEQTILKLLEENKEISCLDIVLKTYILQYNARIWGLRKKGWIIECRMSKVTKKFWQEIKVWIYSLK